MVPFLDLKAATAELEPEITETLSRVLANGWYVLGPEVEAFEAEFAASVGSQHCIGVGNGLDAIELALLALGIEPGDEVIVPANTYIATWLAVTQIGAIVVPVEPDDRTNNIDPDRIEDAITPRTRAVIAVHLYGQPADMVAIRAITARHGIKLVEDAAQAHGASVQGRPVGSLADASAWSFYPSKNLGAIGDGGAVTTSDRAVAEKVRILRNYGSQTKYVNEALGVNSRLDEIQAAVLRIKLPRLSTWNLRRQAIAERYSDELQDVPLRLPASDGRGRHVWHVFVVRTNERDALQRHLTARGVQTLIHYPTPPHLQQAYAHLRLRPGTFPISESIHRECLSLPIGPHLAREQVDDVIAAVRSFSFTSGSRDTRRSA